MLVRLMVHVPVAECPEGRVVARWVMRVVPTGTAPVVTQVVATQCTLPLMGGAVGVTAFDDAEAAPVPAALVAVAANV